MQTFEENWLAALMNATQQAIEGKIVTVSADATAPVIQAVIKILNHTKLSYWATDGEFVIEGAGSITVRQA